MEAKSQSANDLRDYSSISPSAKSLLLLKGLTDIPFARDTAELISLPGKYAPDLENKDTAFWKRVVHFEQRYWSIDKALSFLPVTNILEISSGYSFRGLDSTRDKAVHYIDTDLPVVIEQKKSMLREMVAGLPPFKGTLETISLNALDEGGFYGIADRFPAGPLVILNEGLLMYLDISEKEKLCGIIYKLLQRRGGYWVIGDIYIKSQLERLRNQTDDPYKKFSDEHRIYDNMFESFDAAETFFNKAGFIVDSESEVELSKLSSLKYLLGSATVPELLDLNPADKIRTTWCLKIAEGG